MKFYITKFKCTPKKIKKIDAILLKIKKGFTVTIFFKNGKVHSSKKGAVILSYCNDINFYLNGNYYGNQYNFTKKSWRKFVKMQVFL